MRNGDFSAVSQHIYDPLTGDVNGNNRVPFANNQIPADRISPIAKRAARRSSRCRTSPARRSARTTTSKAQTREKTTDGFDAKVNHTVNQKDQMSYRLSFMRPVVFDPGLFGEYGGPANGGFAGTGTNTAYSTRGDLDARVQPVDAVLDVRGGAQLLPQHDVDDRQRPDDEHRTSASRARTSTTTPAACRSITRSTATRDPLLGFSASQPWDRSEKTWNVVASVTKLMNTSHAASSAASGGRTATSSCRRRTPAVRADDSRSTPTAPGLPPRRRR